MKIPLRLYNFSMTHFSLYLTNMLHSKRNGSKSVCNLAGWIRKFLIPSKLETNFTIFKSKLEFFNDAINSNVKNPKKKLLAGMHELTGLKSNSATNYIQDKECNIIKNAYSATNKFNEHFCSIHNVFKDPTESPSNIHLAG